MTFLKAFRLNFFFSKFIRQSERNVDSLNNEFTNRISIKADADNE